MGDLVWREHVGHDAPTVFTQLPGCRCQIAARIPHRLPRRRSWSAGCLAYDSGRRRSTVRGRAILWMSLAAERGERPPGSGGGSRAAAEIRLRGARPRQALRRSQVPLPASLRQVAEPARCSATAKGCNPRTRAPTPAPTQQPARTAVGSGGTRPGPPCCLALVVSYRVSDGGSCATQYKWCAAARPAQDDGGGRKGAVDDGETGRMRIRTPRNQKTRLEGGLSSPVGWVTPPSPCRSARRRCGGRHPPPSGTNRSR